MTTQTTQPRQAPWAEWFDGRQAIKALPEECVRDCSASGSVDESVEYWVNKLSLEAPPWLLREHLKEYGAWDKGQLCNHQDNLRRLLWLWAIDCHENGSEYQAWLGL